MVGLSQYDSEVIDFAKRHREICVVTKGDEPEEGGNAYYLLIDSDRRPFHLDDRVTELDSRLSEMGYVGDIFTWPASDQQEFHGRRIRER